MLNRSFNAVLVRLAIVAAALALLVLAAPGASADSHATAVEYAENGTDAVASFDATDPEGDSIMWELESEGADGVDNADFEISSAGVLTFKESPDYESPTDRDEDVGHLPVANGCWGQHVHSLGHGQRRCRVRPDG